MPVYSMYRFDSLGRFVEEDAIFSDSPVDLSGFTPPKGHTFVPPPATKEGEVAVWGDGAWRVAKRSEFEPPEPTLDELKAMKKAEIAQARYEAETGGVDFHGVRIATDNRSQSKIAGAALKAMQDPDYTCWWKGETGWVQLDSTTILAIADAVRTHVQSCFDREMELNIDIDMAETAEAVSAIRWGYGRGRWERVA